MSKESLTHTPHGSTNQSINLQGRLGITAMPCERYSDGLATRELTSALAGVEGLHQLNPSQGAGVPESGAPAKGSCSDSVDNKTEIKRIVYPPMRCNVHKLNSLSGGVTRP